MIRVGSRAQVMHGNAKMTGGGLRKKDLTYNNSGKIVSKKMSKIAKNEMRLQKAGYITTKGVFGVKKVDNYKLNKNIKGGNNNNNKKNTPLNSNPPLNSNTMGLMAAYLNSKNKSALTVISKNMSHRSNNICYKSLTHNNEITFNKQSTNLVLKSKQQLPRNIKNVIIDNITDNTTILQIINKLSVSVVNIKFKKCIHLTDDAITTLATKCTGITSIDLRQCIDLTDASITTLATNCTGITSIDLTSCDELTDEAITTLAEKCKGIKYINLNGCSNLTADSISLFSNLEDIKIERY